MKISAQMTRRLALGSLGLALIAALAFVALRSGPLAPVRATVMQAKVGSLSPALFGIGIVEARRAYLIGPIAAGRVRSVRVDVGDLVKAGQLLAEIDPVDLDERLAALTASRLRADSAVAALVAQRQDAVAKKTLAAVNARRYVELGQQNFISTGAVEARLQEQTSADAGVSAADANLAGARQDIARLEAESAGLRQQRANLRLVAPHDGVVTSREAEAGSTVVAGQAVLKMIEPDSLWIRVRFDQGRSTGLAAGLRAEIALRSDPGKAHAGRVIRVEAVSDSVTEERIAQVAFERLPTGLSVGELAEVTLALAPTAPMLLLPNAAIKRVGDQTGVWLVDGQRLRFAALRLGASSLDGQVQVLSGLASSDVLAVYSEKELKADSRVKIVQSLGKTAQ